MFTIKAENFKNKKVDEIEQLLYPDGKQEPLTPLLLMKGKKDPKSISKTKLTLKRLVKIQIARLGKNRLTEDILQKSKSYLEEKYQIEVNEDERELQIHPQIFISLLVKLTTLIEDTWGFKVKDSQKILSIVHLDYKTLKAFLKNNIQVFLIDLVTILGSTTLNSPIGKVISSLLISILTHNLSNVNYSDLAELLKYILYAQLAEKLDEEWDEQIDLEFIDSPETEHIGMVAPKPLAPTTGKKPEDTKEPEDGTDDEGEERLDYFRQNNGKLINKYKNLIVKGEKVCKFLQHIHLICFSSDLNLKNSEINTCIRSLCELIVADDASSQEPDEGSNKEEKIHDVLLLVVVFAQRNTNLLDYMEANLGGINKDLIQAIYHIFKKHKATLFKNGLSDFPDSFDDYKPDFISSTKLMAKKCKKKALETAKADMNDIKGKAMNELVNITSSLSKDKDLDSDSSVLKQMFNQFDEDHSGYIDFNEFVQI